MADLILVKETRERILLNRDAIVSGRQVDAPGTSLKQSVLELTEGKLIVVEESLESLVNR